MCQQFHTGSILSHESPRLNVVGVQYMCYHSRDVAWWLLKTAVQVVPLWNSLSPPENDSFPFQSNSYNSDSLVDYVHVGSKVLLDEYIRNLDDQTGMTWLWTEVDMETHSYEAISSWRRWWKHFQLVWWSFRWFSRDSRWIWTLGNLVQYILRARVTSRLSTFDLPDLQTNSHLDQSVWRTKDFSGYTGIMNKAEATVTMWSLVAQQITS